MSEERNEPAFEVLKREHQKQSTSYAKARDGGERKGDVAWLVVVESELECVGALALGASLKSFETRGQLVARSSPGVSDAWVERLERGGFQVHVGASRLSETEARFRESRLAFGAAFAFTLERFERVVLLEAYALALADVDALFDCAAALCAVYDGTFDRASESSPVSVRPKRDMRWRVRDWLLTSALSFCPYVDPEKSTGADPGCARLPTRYDGSPLLLLLNAGPDAEDRVVRAANAMPGDWDAIRRVKLVSLALSSTLSPWTWYVAPVLPLHYRWRAARDAGAAAAGCAPASPRLGFVVLAPLAALTAAWYASGGRTAPAAAVRAKAQNMDFDVGLVGQACLLLSGVVAFAWVGRRGARRP